MEVNFSKRKVKYRNFPSKWANQSNVNYPEVLKYVCTYKQTLKKHCLFLQVTHPSTKQFLHHVILNSDKFQFLVGSDMPVFKTSETSPDPLNPEMVTARSV